MYARALGSALDSADAPAARSMAANLAALASKAGPRKLELDVRLIQASLNAGRSGRARRLWHRLHCDLTELNEAMDRLLPEPRGAGDPDR